MTNTTKISAINSVRFGNASDGFYIGVYGEEGDRRPPIQRIRFGKVTRTEFVLRFMHALIEDGVYDYSYSDWQSTCRFDIIRSGDQIRVCYWAITATGENKQWEIEFDLEICMTLIGIIIPRSEFIREISIPYKRCK